MIGTISRNQQRNWETILQVRWFKNTSNRHVTDPVCMTREDKKTYCAHSHLALNTRGIYTNRRQRSNLDC